jgi:hypothetical protein
VTSMALMIDVKQCRSIQQVRKSTIFDSNILDKFSVPFLEEQKIRVCLP